MSFIDPCACLETDFHVLLYSYSSVQQFVLPFLPSGLGALHCLAPSSSHPIQSAGSHPHDEWCNPLVSVIMTVVCKRRMICNFPLSLSQCTSGTQIRPQSHWTYAAVRYTITDFRWTLLLCKYVFRFPCALSSFSVVHENISGRYLPKALRGCCLVALTAVISPKWNRLKEICNFWYMWSLYGIVPCDDDEGRGLPNLGVVVLGGKYISSAEVLCGEANYQD